MWFLYTVLTIEVVLILGAAWLWAHAPELPWHD